MKQHRTNRAWCLAALLCLVLLLVACSASSDPLATSSFRSVTVNSKGNVTAEVTLDVREVQAHTGEDARLYELLPGEELSVLTGRAPLDEVRVGSRMEFEFELTDGERTRLYSAFAVGFEDGSFLPVTRGVDDASALAGAGGRYLWETDPKGMLLGDPDAAVLLGTGHGLMEVSLAALCDGEGFSLSFGGEEYTLSERAVTALDRRIASAVTSGMQISLSVTPSPEHSLSETVALLDFLAERYAASGLESVSALYLKGDGLAPSEAAELLRVARLALLSRHAGGRVYLSIEPESLATAKSFFAEVSLRLSSYESLTWHAAVAPTLAKDAPEGALTPEQLSALTAFLREQPLPPVGLAVTGLSYSREDPDAQAVDYLYDYALAKAAGASPIFSDTTGEENGYLAEDGTSLPLEEAIRTVNTGLAPSLLYLCRVTDPEVYAAVSLLSPTRHLQGGGAVTGGGTAVGTLLFDFSEGDTLGFSGVGAVQAPVTNTSAAFGTPVLYTWLDPTRGDVGVRKLLPNGKTLAGVSQLSVELLAQYATVGDADYTLTLLGTDKQGAPLSYTATVKAASGKWTTLTFQVSLFAEEVDSTLPCVVTLTVACKDAKEPFVFWIHAFRTLSPGIGWELILPIAVIPVALGATALLIWLCYRRAAEQKSRRRRG